MKLKNILFTSLLVSGLMYSAQAQFVGDAIIFGQENNGGTARFKGLGNAKTALGGDISSITGNPAGLGFFKQSDISVSVNYNNANNKGTYFGQNTSKNKGRFGIDHAGVVFHFPTNEGYHGWQNFNVGISYENTNTFTNNVRYEGTNPDNSLVNRYSDMASTSTNTNWIDQMYKSILIEEHSDPTKGYFPVVGERANKTQIADVLDKGYNSRTALAFGANYNNVFYIGANLGFTSFRYDHSSQFSEGGWTKNRAQILANNPNSEIADPTSPLFDFVEANYELLDDYYQRTEGSGVDFKIGAIYKPAVDWNIGATISSPTWYTIDDYTDSYIKVDYYDNETASSAFSTKEVLSDPTEDSYNLITPWKFSVGLSKFFSRGLLSADVEYVDYSTMKLRTIGGGNPSREREWDADMKAAYQSAVNVRVGGEVLFTNALSGRAGFNYFGNPYKGADNKQYSGSLGLGAKITQSLYLDLAVVHLVNDYKVTPYEVDETFWNTKNPVADIKHQRTNVVLTLGAKF
ncbi:hypothetical protein E2P86_12715 [Sphingobacterium psychroaquaticum]|uniref:OmpP1/FadL family transporter n=1 Tax=Sphingobacterium psychroaquaticum TaxID=561061 RepID=UPI00106BB423|nr:hypothetical protein [Sphingobacterium psychroaquaticum]QBQ41965.1 hypothetical protein E2P86_12715 [Sphingobacterium psychroaquaticum]